MRAPIDKNGSKNKISPIKEEKLVLPEKKSNKEDENMVVPDENI